MLRNGARNILRAFPKPFWIELAHLQYLPAHVQHAQKVHRLRSAKSLISMRLSSFKITHLLLSWVAPHGVWRLPYSALDDYVVKSIWWANFSHLNTGYHAQLEQIDNKQRYKGFCCEYTMEYVSFVPNYHEKLLKSEGQVEPLMRARLPSTPIDFVATATYYKHACQGREKDSDFEILYNCVP